MKKKWFASAGIFLAMFLGFSTPISAAADPVPMEVQNSGNKILVFAKGIEGTITYASAKIGNRDTVVVDVDSLSDAGSSIKTLVMLDNSISIPQESREKIAGFLSELVDNAAENELYALSTFSEDVTMVQDYTNSAEQFKSALEGIEYQDQETYLTDVLYELIDSGDVTSDPGNYQRLLVISDGVDNKPIGHTAEELKDQLTSSNLPIYSVGVYNRSESNNTELEDMFAISRRTHAEGFLLNEMDSVTPLKTSLDTDQGLTLFTVTPDPQSRDGSEQTMTIMYETDAEIGGSTLTVDHVRMNTVTSSGGSGGQKPGDTPENTDEGDSGKPVNELPPIDGDKKPADSGEAVTEPEGSTEAEIGEPMGTVSGNGGGGGAAGVIGGSGGIMAFVQSHLLLVILLVVAIVAVAVFLLLFFLVFRKKKKQSAVPPVAAPVTEDLSVMNYDKPRDREVSFTAGSKLLTLMDQNQPGRIFQKIVEGQIRIGKSSECDIVIEGDEAISGVHCAIQRVGDHLLVTDFGSKNGTIVDDVKVLDETEIFNGSILRIGREVFDVRIETV